MRPDMVTVTVDAGGEPNRVSVRRRFGPESGAKTTALTPTMPNPIQRPRRDLGAPGLRVVAAVGGVAGVSSIREDGTPLARRVAYATPLHGRGTP